MQITLTDEQHLMLELIADHPLPAIPEIARYTSVLAAARLIQLTADKRWKVTRYGEAMLLSMEAQGYGVH
jgi:hypothetical protein